MEKWRLPYSAWHLQHISACYIWLSRSYPQMAPPLCPAVLAVVVLRARGKRLASFQNGFPTQPVFGWKSHWQPATGKMSTERWAGLSQTQILASIPTGLASFGLGNLGFCRRPQDEQISIKLTQTGVTKVSWSTYCGWRRIRVGKRFPFFCSGSEDLPFSKGGFSA